MRFRTVWLKRTILCANRTGVTVSRIRIPKYGNPCGHSLRFVFNDQFASISSKKGYPMGSTRPPVVSLKMVYMLSRIKSAPYLCHPIGTTTSFARIVSERVPEVRLLEPARTQTVPLTHSLTLSVSVAADTPSHAQRVTRVMVQVGREARIRVWLSVSTDLPALTSLHISAQKESRKGSRRPRASVP